MRDFASIIQNITLAQQSVVKSAPNGNILLSRLWAHECQRVWHDRLLFPEDRESYMNFLKLGMKELEFPEAQIMGGEEPLIFTSFVASCKGHEAAYKQVATYTELNEVLE